MARIRTIKPEFPQSESMGRVSRDARLCFIMLWTIADDTGRLRGNSRMLASLLFPYDEDARGLIDHWLVELEGQHSITRYLVDGESYLQICKWLSHQKIDRPSKSKFPVYIEPSRCIANPRESSSEDQRIKDRGSEDRVPEIPVRFKLEDFDGGEEFEKLCKVYKKAERSGVARHSYFASVEWVVANKHISRKEAADYIRERAELYCAKCKFQKGLNKWLDEKIFEQPESAWSDFVAPKPAPMKNPAELMRAELEGD